MTLNTRELRSIANADVTLKLTLEQTVIHAPGPDEVIVSVEAAPINPSDVSLLLDRSDISSINAGGTAESRQ